MVSYEEAYQALVAWVKTQARVTISDIREWSLRVYRIDLPDDALGKAFATLVADGIIDGAGNVLPPVIDIPAEAEVAEDAPAAPEAAEPPASPKKRRGVLKPLLIMLGVLILGFGATGLFLFPELRFWERHTDYSEQVADEVTEQEETPTAETSQDVTADTDTGLRAYADSLQQELALLKAAATDSQPETPAKETVKALDADSLLVIIEALDSFYTNDLKRLEKQLADTTITRAQAKDLEVRVHKIQNTWMTERGEIAAELTALGEDVPPIPGAKSGKQVAAPGINPEVITSLSARIDSLTAALAAAKEATPETVVVVKTEPSHTATATIPETYPAETTEETSEVTTDAGAVPDVPIQQLPPTPSQQVQERAPDPVRHHSQQPRRLRGETYQMVVWNESPFANHVRVGYIEGKRYVTVDAPHDMIPPGGQPMVFTFTKDKTWWVEVQRQDAREHTGRMHVNAGWDVHQVDCLIRGQSGLQAASDGTVKIY